MNGLNKSLKEKIDVVDSRNINEALNKIKLLKSSNLENSKNQVNTKTYQKISNR